MTREIYTPVTYDESFLFLNEIENVFLDFVLFNG